jgi:hypothetical protein
MDDYMTVRALLWADPRKSGNWHPVIEGPLLICIARALMMPVGTSWIVLL